MSRFYISILSMHCFFNRRILGLRFEYGVFFVLTFVVFFLVRRYSCLGPLLAIVIKGVCFLILLCRRIIILLVLYIGIRTYSRVRLVFACAKLFKYSTVLYKFSIVCARFYNYAASFTLKRTIDEQLFTLLCTSIVE